MSAIAQAYLAACLIELDALKPGNVHRHADGHGMSVADFETSARVSAPEIARAGAPFGARARAAVTTTRASVGQNTNLGIVLLCAPLALAAERAGIVVPPPSRPPLPVLHGERVGVRGASPPPLKQVLAAVLAEAGPDDARDVYAAIAAANPGGLGQAGPRDVRAAPNIPLAEAMADAAARDLVARQFVTGFADIFGLGADALARARAAARSESQAAEAVYLTFLAAHPDSHLARKFGMETAEAVRRDAASRPLRDRAELGRFDAELKARGLNPGTSADLTVATIFADYLANARDEWLAPIKRR